MLKLELSTRERNLLILLFGIVLPAALYLTVIGPKWADIQVKQQELLAHEARVKQLEQVSASDAMQKNIDKLKGQIADLQNAIPKEHSTADFMQHILNSANRAGVELQDVDFEIITEKDFPEVWNKYPELKKLGVVTARAKVKGSYAQIRGFMGKLEVLPRTNVVSSFNIKKEEDGLYGIFDVIGVSYVLNAPEIHVHDVVPSPNNIGNASPF